MGTRPHELERALTSISTQDVSGPVLVVAQGARVDVPPGVEVLQLVDNAGIPGGRDLGMREIDADVVFFLDDDARYVHSRVASDVVAMMGANDDLAAVSLRVTDEAGATLQRHLPRLGGGSAGRSGPVTSFLGGACAIRRSAYLAVGGYHSGFIYGHEEMDLAWRFLDHGLDVTYEASPAVIHPHQPVDAADPARWELLGRNRVVLARRRLPHPVDWIHAATWLLVELVRADTAHARRRYLAGWRAGWTTAVERSPISWSTVAKMTRLGRPPVV